MTPIPSVAEQPLPDEEVAAALDAALDALQKGVPLDRQALLSRHPELHHAVSALQQLLAEQVTRLDNTAPPPPLAAVPEQIGPYRIERQLGSGGFGVVYLAYDPDLKRHVAVKILHPQRLEQAEVVRRFQREACAIARLQHPGIVQLYDYSRSGPPHYLVTEFVEGVDPRLWCQQHSYGFAEVADLVARMAEAVDHAHAHGVYHRDLKPGNILIDAQGMPHILDFGLARLDEQTENLAGEGNLSLAPSTVDGQILGSLAYMAPEQAAGQSHLADGRSDIYALGVILYELLTGQVPFQGPLHSLPARVIQDNPPSPRSLQPTLSPDLEAICLKAMAKRPGDRYSSCSALAGELRAYLRGEPIEAQRLTWVVWVQRFLNRRHQETRAHGWQTLLLLLGVTIFTGCAVSNYWEIHKQQLALVLTKLTQVGIMLYLVIHFRPIKEPVLTATERAIWSLIPGYYGGYLTLVLLNGLLDHTLPVAALLAVLSGMGFATLGATLWGWFHVWSVAFFLLAVLIVFCAPYGLTLLGLGWLLCLGLGSIHMQCTR